MSDAYPTTHAKTARISSCENCGMEVIGGRGPKRRWCSFKCRYRKRQRILVLTKYRKENPLSVRSCAVCSVQFTPDKNNRTKKCQRCKDKYKVECNLCGTAFIGYRQSVRCLTCKGLPRPLPPRKCDGCKKMFSPPASHPGQRWHSKRCSDRFYAHVRRIRTEVIEEDVTLDKLEQRDGPYCGLCAGKIDMRLRYPHSDCAVIDHIIPLSRDGKHRMDNCQLAHSRCNGSKGNRYIHRAFLFGVNDGTSGASTNTDHDSQGKGIDAGGASSRRTAG